MSTVANSGDGLSRMVQNPKRYFAKTRTQTAAQVDAEIKRDRHRSAAERNGAADPDQR